MPLYTFVSELDSVLEGGPGSDTRARIADLLCISETHGYTWLIRPAIRTMFPLLYKAMAARQIHGAFIYSNNGSEELVKFLAYFLNRYAQYIMCLPELPTIFRMAIWNGAPCRRRTGEVKSYAAIQSSLAAAGLPVCAAPNELLFYDDMRHVLADDGAHYKQVSPYFYHTSVLHLVTLFETLVTGNYDKWRSLAKRAAEYQLADMRRSDNTYILEPPPADYMRSDATEFVGAYRDFLAAAAVGARGKTRSKKRYGRGSPKT